MSRKPRHESFTFGPVSDVQYKFQRKLAAMRDAIKLEADGRVCGNCKFYKVDCCVANTSVVTGDNLTCSKESAACKKYEPANE